MIEHSNQGEKEPGSPELLRNILAEVTFKPGRAIPADITGIDLGVFLDEARLLANESFLDPLNNSTVKLIYITGAGKVRVPNRFYKGFAGILVAPLLVTRFPREVVARNRLDEPILGMVIHTNENTDSAFSEGGLGLLMRADYDPISTTALFLAGKTKNMLFFRGKNTPQMSGEDMDKRVRLWILQLRERIKQFLEPAMSAEERLAIASRAENALARQICQKYDLSYFAAPHGNRVITRQTP